MASIKTIDGLEVAGRRVLVRADLNLPMRHGRVTDTTRIERTLPTLTELIDRGGRVVVLSHLGRPGGTVSADLSLRPVAAALAAAGGRQVAFAADCIGAEAEAVVAGLADGDMAMLENLRFHPGEEANDPAFAESLARLGDLYVSDAFSCAHRAHASTEGLARLLPAAAGRLMEAELHALTAALENPAHLVAALVGGAKISTKMAVLGHLADTVDLLIIGGAMANTFLHARGIKVGRSLAEPDRAEAARAIMAAAEKAGCEIVLPIDAVVAPEFKQGARATTVGLDAVPAEAMILDIGPATVSDLTQRLGGCRTVIWNGPLGAFEVPPFDAGTNAVAQAVARLTTSGGLLSVAGGGDTVAALAQAGVLEDFSYVSTAGGAFLEWLEGHDLPGVAVLRA